MVTPGDGAHASDHMSNKAPNKEESKQGLLATLRWLREVLTVRFNEAELRTLSFDLGIDYDDLPGEGKANKARELVAYCARHNRISELVEMGEKVRPDISWIEIVPATKEVSSSLKNDSTETVPFHTGGGVTIGGEGVQIDVGGDIVGGNKTVINSSNIYIVGGDLFQSQITDRQELVAELQKLLDALKEVVERQEIDEEEAILAAAQVEAGISNAKKPTADPDKITRRLNQAKEIIEKTTDGVGAAAGLVTAFVRAIEMVRQFYI